MTQDAGDEGAPPDAAERAFNEARGGKGGADEMPAIDFATLILSLSHAVLLHLGDAPDPLTGDRNLDLPLARQNIDLIALLQDKTRGNLTGAEESMLSQALYDLRMRYVEVSRAK